MVPLSALVTTRRITGPEYTNRFNLYRAAQVIGAAAPGYIIPAGFYVVEKLSGAEKKRAPAATLEKEPATGD